MLDSTRQFIQAMDAKNIKHSDIEVTDSGMEKVTVIYTGDSIPSIRMIFFFNKDCEDVAIRVFDIVKLPENKIDGFFKVVNEANRRFRFSSSCWTPRQHRSGGDGRRLPHPRRGRDLPGADEPLRGHLRQGLSRLHEGPVGLKAHCNNKSRPARAAFVITLQISR